MLFDSFFLQFNTFEKHKKVVHRELSVYLGEIFITMAVMFLNALSFIQGMHLNMKIGDVAGFS